MASNWRGYRLLHLGGRRFRWTCVFNEPADRHSAGYAERGHTWPADRLVVRAEDGPHRVLTVTWPACLAPLFKAGFVRACVEEGLRRGWPDEAPALTFPGSEVAEPEPKQTGT